ncbi:hypothetical protein ACP275_11G042600 [Erythranthe tilingii]
MELENPNEIMSNELVPMEETQPIESDLQLDIIDTEPNHYEMAPPDITEQPPTKRRKKKSIVWEHFTIETVGAGCRRACCKQCKQSFAYSTGSKVAGTSHLKRHIAKGTCPVVLRNQEKNQQLANSPYSAPSKLSIFSETPKRRYRTASVPLVSFDADRCRREISRMIIMHDYPLHMVEHPGFLAFVQNLQPRFDMVSFNTVQGDIVATYLREKQSILRVVEGMPGRICLTLDLWSSSQSTGYMFVSGQFIDSDWKMHRKLLNVIRQPYPESDTAFSHSVSACLSDWGMDGKLISVTINQPLSEASVDNLRALLSVKNPLLLDGQLLVGGCLARSLSTIVQDGLAFAQGVVKKVRDSVKYVKTSESLEEKFNEIKQTHQVPSSKKLEIDDQTRWNTTYEMLSSALELKKVFTKLGESDPDYKDPPSEEDWSQIQTLCQTLKQLFDIANILTVPPTTKTIAVFHEVWKVQLDLARSANNKENQFLSGMTKSMYENFDKYWKSTCYILAIAVVMDPRFKMKLVEFTFVKIYGEERAASFIKIVDEGIHELFHEYLSFPMHSTHGSYGEDENGQSVKIEDSEGMDSNGLGLSDFDAYIMETTSQLSKTELDQYLEESLLPRVHDFDVVGWWKLNRIKYPTLSKMARDVLSVPVCTVPGNMVFDTVRREMDSYRSSLRSETVEALICAKDWLQPEKLEGPAPVIKMEIPI